MAGKVRHFYDRISVASVEITRKLSVGDFIHIKGHFTDFDQEIQSMEARHEKISQAAAGMIVGIRVDSYVRKNDSIYKREDAV